MWMQQVHNTLSQQSLYSQYDMLSFQCIYGNKCYLIYLSPVKRNSSKAASSSNRIVSKLIKLLYM